MEKHQVRKRILSLLCAALLVFGTAAPALAQESPAPEAPVSQMAQIVTGYPITQQEYSLVFEGEIGTALLERLLQVLDSHGVKAGFFVPALTLAEQPDIAQRITAAGHWMGNYLLRGERRVQNLSEQEQQSSLQRAQEILTGQTGTAPVFARANVTEYNDSLRRVIAQAGIPYILAPNTFLNHTSFTSPEQTRNYLGRLPLGGIISFKVNQPLEASEMPERAAKPTQEAVPDATPGPKAGGEPMPTYNTEERFLQVVDWLLSAAKEHQRAAVSPQTLMEHQQGAYGTLMRQVGEETHSAALALQINDQSPKARVLSSQETLQKEISLVFEGTASPQTLSAIRGILQSRGVKAAFFVPAMGALQAAQQLSDLAADGHVIGNYLLEGERHAEQLARETQVRSILRAQMILEGLGFTPSVLRANLSQADDGLLQATAAAGITQLVVPTRFLNHTSFTSPTQADSYIQRLRSGTVVSIKMNQVLDASEVEAPKATKAPDPTPAPTASQQPVSDVSDPTPVPAQQAEQLPVEERLLQVVDWTTQALTKQKFALTSLAQLEQNQQAPLAAKVRDIMGDETGKELAQGLDDSAEKAIVIRSGTDIMNTKRYSLVFEGTISQEGLTELGALLSGHGVTASFFLPGHDLPALAQPLEQLIAQGNEVGNYLLQGEKQADTLPDADIAISLDRAQKIAAATLGKAPTLLKGNDTQPSESLLRIAKKAGLQAYVQPLQYLNHTSFTNQQQAASFVGRAQPGTIVAIKINDTLSASELKKPEETPKPSTLAAPTNQPQPADTRTPEERVIEITGWLLDAYASAGYTAVLPGGITQGQIFLYGDNNQELQATEEMVSAGLLASLNGESPQAEVIASGAVQQKEISLIIEAMEDLDAVESAAAILNNYQIKAAFFLPATLMHQRPQLARSLRDAGHQVGNYMLNGETKAQNLSTLWQAESILRAQQMLADATGQAPELFKGNISAYSPGLLQVIKAAGLTYALEPGTVLNATSFTSQQQAESFARRTQPGALITIKLDRAIDISEVPAREQSAGGSEAQKSPAPPAASQVPIPNILPAADDTAGQPTIQAGGNALPIIEWLALAYSWEGFTFVSPQQLAKAQQSEYARFMRAVEEEKITDGLINSLTSSSPKAQLLQNTPILDKQISLVIEGVAQDATVRALLEQLEELQIKALFYLPANHAAAHPDTIKSIIDAGHRVGNYGLNGETRMQDMSAGEAIKSIYGAQLILTNLTGIRPDTFKGSMSQYSDTLLQAVRAVDIPAAVQPSLYVNHSSFRDSAQVNNFVQRTDWGSILSIKWNQALDASELPAATPRVTAVPPEATPLPETTQAPDTTPAPTLTPQPTPEPQRIPDDLDNEGKLLLATQWLLESYIDQGFTFVSPEEIAKGENQELTALLTSAKKPSGGEAVLVTQALTTDKELSLLIRLPQNPQDLAAVREYLKNSKEKSAIIVTGQDAAAQPEVIKELAKAGHAIVNGGFTGGSVSGLNYQEAYQEIQRNALLLKEKLGVETKHYAPLSGRSGVETLQAASDAGVSLLSFQTRVAPLKSQTAEDVLADRFKWGVRRGEIIRVDLDGYTQTTELLQGIEHIVADTGYRLVTPDALLDNTYTLQPLESIPGWNSVRVNMDYDKDAPLGQGYLSRLVTDERRVFLVIDDWGSDKTITRMLDILKEHDVKATFFVIASRAANNPNLLRAIDEAGHSIGNHSYNHELMPYTDPQLLQELTVKAFQEVTVALGHTPDLLFQPPQLSTDRKSINAILATGYQAVIGSRVSTHDYTRNAQQVLRFVKRYINNGAMVLIHSSDNASANEALPEIIEYARSQGFTFDRLGDYFPLKIQDGRAVPHAK